MQGGTRSVTGVMAATRAGKGCGSCKALVAHDRRVGGRRATSRWTRAPRWYVPSIPLEKPELIAAIRERGLRSVSAVFAALAPNGEDAGSKMALASLLKTLWAGEYVDERDARFINDRVHANIQRDGTFSVVPRIAGGVTTRRAAAPDRRRRRQVPRSR